MIKWETIFRDLDEALTKVASRYKPTSQMGIIALLPNNKTEHWKVPFSKVRKKIWEISSEYPHTVLLSVRTIRNKVLYEVVRYPLLRGQGAGSIGDETTIEKFNLLGEDDRSLLVRLLHSQIQDRFTVEALNEQSQK